MSILPASHPPSRQVADTGNGWRGAQGAAWAARNPRSVDELDWSYHRRFGITRTELSREYIGNLSRDASILEVGCSRGTQLEVLERIGFTRLYGVDLSWGALTDCRFPRLVADGLTLPFPDGGFDLVFTSGTLMHIPPEQRVGFCAEMLRVSRRWIWGFEVWHAEGVKWNFGTLLPSAWALPEPASYFMADPSLRLVKERNFPGGMAHHVFLLEKRERTGVVT